jgi:hypothetical protein
MKVSGIDQPRFRAKPADNFEDKAYKEVRIDNGDNIDSRDNIDSVDIIDTTKQHGKKIQIAFKK